MRKSNFKKIALSAVASAVLFSGTAYADSTIKMTAGSAYTNVAGAANTTTTLTGGDTVKVTGTGTTVTGVTTTSGTTTDVTITDTHTATAIEVNDVNDDGVTIGDITTESGDTITISTVDTNNTVNLTIGDITNGDADGAGTVVITGVNSTGDQNITATVGSIGSAANKDLDALTITSDSTNSASVIANGNIFAATTTLGGGASVLTLGDHNITGNIAMTGDGSILNIGTSTITGAISTSTSDYGTINVTGKASVSGTIGVSGSEMLALNVTSDGNFTTNDTSHIKTITNEGILTTGGATTATTVTNSGTMSTGANVLTATTVTNTGTLNLGGATHVITALENNGTLNMSDVSGGAITGSGTTNILDDITASGAITQGSVNVAHNKTLTSGGAITATTVNLDGNATNDSNLVLQHDLTGNLTTSVDNTGTLTVNTSAVTIDGDIGTSTKALKSATVTAKTLTIADGHNVYIGTTTLSASADSDLTLTGSAVLHGNVVMGADAGSTLTIGTGGVDGNITNTTAGTNGVVAFTDDTTTLGLIGVVGGNELHSVTVASGKTLTVAHNIAATTIELGNNADTKLSTSADVTIEGAIAANTQNVGIFDVNNDVTVTGTIGASNKEVDIEVANGKTLTVSSTVNADAVTFEGASAKIATSAATTLGSSTLSNLETLANGTEYTLVEVTGAQLTLTSDLTVADTGMIDYTVTKDVDGLGTTDSLKVQADYRTASDLGMTGNTANVMNSAATAIASDSEIFTVLNGYANDTAGKASIDAAVATMAPDTSAASVGAVNISNGAMATVGGHIKVARVQGLSQGMSTGDKATNTFVWGQAYNTNADQDDIGGVSGYDSKGNGLVLGVDKQLNENTLYGFAFSFGSNDVTSKNTTTKAVTSIDSKQLTAYISKTDGEFYMDGMFSYAQNDNTGSRHVVVGTIDRTATSSYDSQVLSAKLGAGANIGMSGYTLTPNMSVTYSAISTDSYTETGAGSMNLTVANADMDKVTALAGINLSKTIKTASGAKFTPELRVAFQNELGDKYATSTSTFSGGGSSFTTDGLKADSSAMVYGFGANYVTSNKMTEVKFGYDQTQASRFTSDAATLTARFRF